MYFLKRRDIVFRISFFILLFSSSFPLASYARKFYFSTSGNDNYTIAQAQNQATPWKSLQRLQSFSTSGAAAGDTFAFKCGETFTGIDRYGSLQWGLPFNNAPSGTSTNPIVFSSYGTGAKPNFLFPTPSTTIGSSRIVFAVDRSQYIIFDGLQFNDNRFSVNDKVSTCFTKTGILLGEENAKSSNCTIKNCYFNNIGCGIEASGNYLNIINNEFNNMKNWGDTATMADIGCVPMSLSSGHHYLIKGNKMKGGWGFSGATASGEGLNGTGLELVNDFDSSMIIYNTIIDCAGGMEFGNITGNPAVGANNDTFAYNKFINNGVFCYINTPGTNLSQLHFYNNVYVENAYSRFTGNNFGNDVYGDGQSFSSFPSWPNFPKNPSVSNYGGFRVLQYTSETGLSTDSLIVSRNNIFWMTNRNQAIYDNTRVKFKHANNIYHIVGQAVLGGTLNIGNLLESSTTAKIFTDTSNIHPENWNFQPYSGSPAINFGRNVGFNTDFSGLPINANPDAGIHEFTTSAVSPLVATATSGSILCYGGTTSVIINATGGLTPYTGIGTFSAIAGTSNYQVTDALGNISNVSITITQPPALNATVSAGRIITFGGNTSITVTASGGTGTYTYQLNNGMYQSSNMFQGVTAGTHNLNIKDANGCILIKSITITQPSAPLTITVTAASNPLNCNGGSTIVSVTASGGTAPYSGTGNFTALAGNNTFTVADSNGVTTSSTILISQPTAITGNVTAGTISIYGAKTTVTVSGVAGGSSPYTYAINGGVYQTSNVFSNVGAGQYQVFIKDSKNCVLTKSLTITQPASTLNATATATTILCNGNTAVVTVNATGGTAPYTGTGTFTVIAGTYNYTVTDAVGSTRTVTITITQPTAIVPNITTGRIIINGGNTTISATATGGRGSLSFKLNTGLYQNTGQFSGVLAGNHTVYIKDSNNCIVSRSITINQPAVFSAAASLNAPINCNGGSTSATITATGGTPPYTGTGTYNVSAGTTSFNVTDSNGVVTTTSINVVQPTRISATVTNTTISVYGARATINIATVSGGTSPYSYALNAGAHQTNNSFNNVAAGSHTVFIKDSKGCIVNYPLTITQPASTLSCNSTATNISCYGGTAIVTVSATGGTPPYTGTGNFNVSAGTYTYTVSDAVGSTKSTTITVSQPSVINPGIMVGNILAYGGNTNISINASGGTGTKTYKLNNGVYQTSNIFSGITAGIDTIYVKDSNNCVVTQIVNITQPDPFNIGITSTKISCFGSTSTVTVTASGGVAPYTGTGNFTVSAGAYTYTVRDANGIVATSNITISQPSQITGSATSGTVNNIPYPATATISVSNVSGGVQPYSYSLDGGTYQTVTMFNNVVAGNHTILIKDSNNCTLPKNVNIIQPLRLIIAGKSNSCINQSNGSYTFTAVGGTRPYRFKISTSSSALGNTSYVSDSVFRNLSARIYYMRVKDTIGTSYTTTDTIINISCARSSAIDANLSDEFKSSQEIFAYPNPSSDKFTLTLPNHLESFDELKIYDANGRKLLSYSLVYASKNTIIINNLKNGIYLVSVRKGDAVRSVKIVKL